MAVPFYSAASLALIGVLGYLLILHSHIAWHMREQVSKRTHVFFVFLTAVMTGRLACRLLYHIQDLAIDPYIFKRSIWLFELLAVGFLIEFITSLRPVAKRSVFFRRFMLAGVGTLILAHLLSVPNIIFLQGPPQYTETTLPWGETHYGYQFKP